MPTRTWLTTPPGRTPATEGRDPDEERWVPAPDLPREPRPPGRHRRTVSIVGLVAALLVVVALLVIGGERAQREDPAVPEAPGDGADDPTLEPPEPELPES